MKKGLSPLIGHGCRILILGTMPGEKSLLLQQYYANPANHFRKLVFAVYDQPFEVGYDAFKRLLIEQNIGLWNVIGACKREGSSDRAITDIIVNDLNKLYEEYPGIQYVFFESASAEKFHAKFASRKNDLYYGILPSASGRYSRITFSEKLEQWKILRNCVTNPLL